MDITAVFPDVNLIFETQNEQIPAPRRLEHFKITQGEIPTLRAAQDAQGIERYRPRVKFDSLLVGREKHAALQRLELIGTLASVRDQVVGIHLLDKPGETALQQSSAGVL